MVVNLDLNLFIKIRLKTRSKVKKACLVVAVSNSPTPNTVLPLGLTYLEAKARYRKKRRSILQSPTISLRLESERLLLTLKFFAQLKLTIPLSRSVRTLPELIISRF